MAMTNSNSHELAVALFEDSGDALFLFELETEQLVDANPVAERLTGTVRSELLRCPVTHLFRCDRAGGLARLRQALPDTGLLQAREGFHLRTHQAGTWIPVNVRV